MDFFEVVRLRQSIRIFASQPVEDEKLETILDAAANRAPSAGNLQSYRVYVVKRLEDRRALRRAVGDREHVTSAPVVLVFCSDPERAVGRYGERGVRYSIQDATIAATFAMLAAEALGIASVPVGSFDDEGVRWALGAPESVTPVLMLPLGYAAESPERRVRLPMGRLVYCLGE